MSALGPDAALDKHARLSTIVGGNDRGNQGPLVILFREPPAPGTRIEVTEEQVESFGGRRPSYTNYVVVEPGGNPYFFLLGSGWWGYRYRVGVRVSVNGVPIADGMIAVQ
jgi:hypothetical protein